MEWTDLIIALAVLFGIVMICRELNCWYLKINKRIDLMNQMIENQEKMIRLLKGEKIADEKKEKAEITDIDGWIKGGSGKEEDSEEKDEFTVGSVVSSMVEKDGVQIGDVLNVTKVGKDHVVCSLEGKNVGKFKFDEVFLVK